MKKYKTLKNKVAALIFLALGAFSVTIDNDATAFVLMILISIPLIFAKKNVIDVDFAEFTHHIMKE